MILALRAQSTARAAGEGNMSNVEVHRRRVCSSATFTSDLAPRTSLHLAPPLPPPPLPLPPPPACSPKVWFAPLVTRAVSRQQPPVADSRSQSRITSPGRTRRGSSRTPPRPPPPPTLRDSPPPPPTPGAGGAGRRGRRGQGAGRRAQGAGRRAQGAGCRGRRAGKAVGVLMG
jgi:hypothetical protein